MEEMIYFLWVGGTPLKISRGLPELSGNLHKGNVKKKEDVGCFNDKLSGRFKYVLFSPLSGEMIQFD